MLFSKKPKSEEAINDVSVTPVQSEMSPAQSESTISKSGRIGRKSNGSRGLKKEPPQLARRPSVQTRYMDMLLQLDTIPRLHNILASFCTWLLLAGYVVFPGTFTTVEQGGTPVPISSHDIQRVDHAVVDKIRNAPLLWIAGVCCVIGGSGMIWFWWRWRSNYVWLINKIFLYVFQLSEP